MNKILLLTIHSLIILNVFGENEYLKNLAPYRMSFLGFEVEDSHDAYILKDSLVYSLEDNLMSVKQFSMNIHPHDIELSQMKKTKDYQSYCEKIGVNHLIHATLKVSSQIRMVFKVYSLDKQSFIFKKVYTSKKEDIEKSLDLFALDFARSIHVKLSSAENKNIKNNYSSYENLLLLGEIINSDESLKYRISKENFELYDIYYQNKNYSKAFYKDPYLLNYLVKSNTIDDIDFNINGYHMIFKIKPFYPRAYYELNLILLDQEKYREAYKYTYKAYQQAPSFGHNLISMGSRSSQLNRIDDARKYSRLAIKALPNDDWPWENHILSFVNKKEYELALKVAEIAHQSKPESISRTMKLAYVHWCRRDYHNSFKYYNEALKLCDKRIENSGYLVFRLAECLLKLKHYKKALGVFHYLHLMNYSANDLFYNMGIIYKNHYFQNETAAKMFYKEIFHFGLESRSLIQLSHIYREQGDYEGAYSVFKKLLQIKEHPMYYNNASWFCLLSKYDLDEATELIEKSKQYSKNGHEYKGTLAWIHLFKNECTKAKTLADELIDLGILNEAYAIMTVLHLLDGDQKNAKRIYENCYHNMTQDMADMFHLACEKMNVSL